MNRITRPNSLLKASVVSSRIPTHNRIPKSPHGSKSRGKWSKKKEREGSREQLYSALTKTTLEEQIKVMNNKKNF